MANAGAPSWGHDDEETPKTRRCDNPPNRGRSLRRPEDSGPTPERQTRQGPECHAHRCCPAALGPGASRKVMAEKQLEAALASARALVASLEAALEQAEKPAPDPALTLEAAAKAAQLSPHTLRTWCKSGRLRCARGPR